MLQGLLGVVGGGSEEEWSKRRRREGRQFVQLIGKGLGWETGWAAHRERWTRLIAIHRWLDVEKEALYGEDMDYDCLKAPERDKTVLGRRGQRCTNWVVGMGASLDAPQAWSVVKHIEVGLCVLCMSSSRVRAVKAFAARSVRGPGAKTNGKKIFQTTLHCLIFLCV